VRGWSRPDVIDGPQIVAKPSLRGHQSVVSVGRPGNKLSQVRRRAAVQHCSWSTARSGDTINALLATAGYNFRRLLAWLRLLLLRILIALSPSRPAQMHVHPVLRWNLKLQQPQLPRSEPDGQPTESSQPASSLTKTRPGQLARSFLLPRSLRSRMRRERD
jgi:hypothetical protein